MRLLLLLLFGALKSHVYETVPGTSDFRFRNDTAFYRKYERNIIRGAADCMQSTGFTLSSGDIKTFPGIYWEDQKSGASIIDYEKCVYYISGIKTTHSDAEFQCEEKIASKCPPLDCQSTLASIHTEAQNTNIGDYIASDPNDSGKPYWFGLRQFCANCPFQNNDHSPVDFISWEDGEPNNSDGDEDCVEFLQYNNKWNDNNCVAKRQMICQIYLAKDRQHPKPNIDTMWPTTGGCKNGWTLYGKACFRIFGSKYEDGEKGTALPFDQANAECSKLWPGSKLAILPNEYYQYFTNSMVRNNGRNVWIGLLSTTTDNTFHWVDGSRLTFSYWEQGEPNNYNDDEDKVEIQWYNDVQFGTKGPGQWNDIEALATRSYMCFHQLDRSETQATSPWCPEGWQQAPRINSFCYKLVTGQDTDFDGAQNICEGLSSETGHTTNLASIEDIYEDNFVASLLYSKETNYDPTFAGTRVGIWIGLTGTTVSGTSGQSVKWQWQDGFPTAYTRWGANEPKLDHVPMDPQKGCVYIDKDRNWYTATTCELKQAFVCKANIAEVDPIYDASDDRGALLDCPAGWEVTGNVDEHTGHHCMKAFVDSVSWFEANHMCNAALGGHLISIHSPEFNQRVLSLSVNTHGKSNFWIGMNRNDAGGLTWSDGSPTTYFNWAPNEPSYEWGGEAEDCVELYETGLWNDQTCSEKRPFVCKTTRPMENCIDIAEVDKKQCGYPGISAWECENTLKCCYNGGDVFGVSCYHPAGRKGSLTPGAAAGIATAVWLCLIGALVVYFMFFKSGGGPTSFTNPMN